MSYQDDKEISFQAIPQDWEGFCNFIESHYQVIYTVALAHVRDAEIAQEITQDVCVRLLLQRESIPPLKNSRGWLAIVARNTAIDWIRHRQVHSRILETMRTLRHDQSAVQSRTEDSRARAIRIEEVSQLHAVLDNIPAQDREMLFMYYMDGMEKQEIARILEVHPSTVGRNINRILAELRRAMADFDPAMMRALQPEHHNAKLVLGVLGVVAALSAAEKAALAAVAQPLPVLSAGSSAMGSATPGVQHIFAQAKSYLGGGGWVAVAVVAVLAAGGLFLPRGPERVSVDTESSSGSQLKAVSSLQVDNRRPVMPVRRQSGRSVLSSGFTAPSANVTRIRPTGETDGQTLRGIVTNEEGDGVPASLVTVWSSDVNGETSRSVITDASGRFVFEGLVADVASGMIRTVHVTASSNGFASTPRGRYQVQLPLPSIDVEMELTLEQPRSVFGSVVDPAGNAVAGARVYVVSESDENDIPYESGYRHEMAPVLTDQQGRFDIPSRNPGSVILAVEHPGYAYKIIPGVKVGGGDVTPIKLNRGVDLECIVMDGVVPVSGMQLELSGSYIWPWNIKAATATTDSDGRAVFSNVAIPDPDKPYWSYSVRCRGDNIAVPVYRFKLYRGESSRVLEMNTQDNRIATGHDGLRQVIINDPPPSGARGLKPGTASLHGTLEGGSALSESRGFKVRVTDDDLNHFETPIDNGRFELDGIPPGRYNVTVFNSERGRSSAEGLYEPVWIDLKPGQLHTVSMRVGSGHMTGSVLGWQPGTTGTLTLLSRERHWPSVRTVAVQNFDQPKFYFRGLPTGRYHLIVKTDAGQVTAQSFEIRAGESVTCSIELPFLHHVSGILLDPSNQDPVSHTRLTISRLDFPIASQVRSSALTTAADGSFQTSLGPGSYRLYALLPDAGWVFNKEIRITSQPVHLGTLPMTSANSGIIIETVMENASCNAEELDFDLIPVAGERERTQPFLRWAIDDSRVMLRHVPPGRYRMVVRSYPLTEAKVAIANVVVSEIEVRPDAFTEIALTLHRGTWVELACAHADINNHEQTRFWLADANETTIPLVMGKYFGTRTGLMPGKYVFGASFADRPEQTVNFEVRKSTDPQKVILHMP